MASLVATPSFRSAHRAGTRAGPYEYAPGIAIRRVGLYENPANNHRPHTSTSTSDTSDWPHNPAWCGSGTCSEIPTIRTCRSVGSAS